MQTRKLVGGVTIVALLASDLGFGVVSALGQSMGNGHVPVPSLTDGALGSAPPAAAAPYQQQLLPQQAPQRQFSPAPAKVSQTPAFEPGRPAAGQGQMAGAPEAEELSRVEAVFNLDPIRQFTVPMATERIAFQRRASLEQQQSQQQGQAQTELQQQQANLQQQQSGDRLQLALQQPYQPPAMLGPYGAPLRQYGYAMFASNVSTFAPIDDIPVGPDYVLGPGDDLTINVWGAVDSTLVKTVDRNGRIVLPKVGDLRIWGLTFAQADRLIREQLSRYFRGFQTSVTMGRLRTVSVHVVGEVCQPGAYTLSALSTVTNALFSAGGPTKLGTLRDVRLIRGSSQVAKLDLYDFLQRGDRTRDFRLESGDTIFVPTIGDVVAVAGEVKRPAIYEVHSTTRLSEVVDLAGGVTPTSYLKRVHITVKVDGAVKYPGSYELKPMMRISQLLPAERLLPEAYPERVEVARRRPDLSMEVVPVNLKKAWTGDPEQDLLLKP